LVWYDIIVSHFGEESRGKGEIFGGGEDKQLLLSPPKLPFWSKKRARRVVFCKKNRLATPPFAKITVASRGKM
jgi:hypothetical protein